MPLRHRGGGQLKVGTWVKIGSAFTSLALLECNALVNAGSPFNLDAAMALYELAPLDVKILEIAVLSNQRADFRRFLTHVPLSNSHLSKSTIHTKPVEK